MTLASADILDWLDEVKDPEIPVLSVVDLGVITGISVDADCVKVEMTPTFVGCPALDFMKGEVLECLRRHGVARPEVEVNFRKPWSSDRITEKGRRALQTFGLAPPAAAGLIDDIAVMEHAACPRCNGTNTELKNPFGPTLCRSIHYCNDCREAFEQFKPV